MLLECIGEPIRHQIIRHLENGPKPVYELARLTKRHQATICQHLAVLRNAGLVSEQRQGRFMHYEVDPEGLAQIAGWLAKYRAYWPQRVDALKGLLKDMDQ